MTTIHQKKGAEPRDSAPPLMENNLIKTYPPPCSGG